MTRPSLCWRRFPLSVRLVVLITVLVALALGLSATAGTQALRSYLLTRVDAQLTVSANEWSNRRNDAGFAERMRGPFFRQNNLDTIAPTDSSFVLIVDASGVGSLDMRTPPGVEPSQPRLPTLDARFVAEHDGIPFSVKSVNGEEDWRIVVNVLSANERGVAVGRTMSEVDRTVERLWRINMGIGLGVLTVLSIAAFILVRSALRGLRGIERTAAAIAGGDLTQRVEGGDANTELGRLANSLNHMLTQIEASFAKQRASEETARESQERMRQFVADASHELRTPLTSVRGFAELYRQDATRSESQRSDYVRRVEQEALRMSSLVEALLTLARLDEKQSVARDCVDVTALAREIVESTQLLHPTRSVTYLGSFDRACVSGSREWMHQILTNLVNNALVHAGEDASVRVGVEESTNEVIVRVSDDGIGLRNEDHERIFERFYRADQARSRHAKGGAGLGLSIVAGLTEAQGGEIRVESAEGNGATFTLTFPKCSE